MSEMQRYDLYFNPHGEDYIKRMVGGQFVLYADHVAAITACEARVRDSIVASYRDHYDKGVSDERGRIKAAVIDNCRKWHATRNPCGICRSHLEVINEEKP